jgi:hypothetical protein
MRQLKLSSALASLAVLIAATLITVGHRSPALPGLDTPFAPTATLFCFGLNAPAALLTIPAIWSSLPRFEYLGFSASEWCFLIGVALTWFTVGLAFQFRRSLSHPYWRWISRLLSLLAGIVLAYQSRLVYSQPYNNPFGNKVEFALFILWTIVLLLYFLGFPRYRTNQAVVA